MAIIKLISDFDGVWTDQQSEAEYVWNYIVTRLSQLTGEPPLTIEGLLDESKKDMDKSPHEYGWFNNGYIAAFYQEDPFGDNNAIFNYIERAGRRSSHSNFKQKLARIKEAVESKERKTLAEFSNDCFVKSTTQFKLEGKLKPDAAAGKIVKELNSKGVEIVVVSNSKTEKIEHLFLKAEQKATNEQQQKRGRLHARGDAKKFEIDNTYSKLPEYLEVTAKYKVSLRRSGYHKILMEEKPDYVLGDVFSLDLALPVYLRMKERSFRHMKVIQKLHPYTPKWVKDYLSKEELRGFAFTIKSLDELPGIISNAK
jgi:FMN phosphatase YigB (HAD superfamily)